ncbi:MAG TPA: type II toxin-antitoxin system VapC family toxin [Candidatus Sulfotelmatobacter sp.]|nr:type II toxin-antitoxin system VapC family toxin [Candidatus Sulfotelmatobacter sp.]
MKRFVLDASVALAWFLDHPVPSFAHHVRKVLSNGGHRAVVPGLWQLEMANGFVMAERRGLVASMDTDRFLHELDLLVKQTVEVASSFVHLSRAVNSARQHRLTAYDAVYLDLARELLLPIATLDRQLRAAASQAGVQLFQ